MLIAPTVLAALIGLVRMRIGWRGPVRAEPPAARDRILELDERFVRRQLGPPIDAEAGLDRVLDGVRDRFPGRSEIWCLERVIDDLERDRS
jgi:hypothetical protein